MKAIDRVANNVSMQSVASTLKVLAIVATVIVLFITVISLSQVRADITDPNNPNGGMQKLDPSSYGIQTTGSGNIEGLGAKILSVLKIGGIVILSLASMLGLWYIVHGFMKMAKDERGQEQGQGKKIGIGFVLVMVSIVIAIVWASMNSNSTPNNANAPQNYPGNM